jgi:hypothetical protein
LVVLRDLLEIQAASPHSWLAETIERMQTFAAALACPDGGPAFYKGGDVDAPALELPEASEGLAVFEASGFVVARDGPLWLAFRCGPLADALSFQLWWRDLPVLAHSGVAVDGREQIRPAKVSLRYARERAVEASVVLPGRLRHVRRLEWDGNEVWVQDQFEGKGRHRVEPRLVWARDAPEVKLELQGSGVVELEFPATIGFRLRCLE